MHYRALVHSDLWVLNGTPNKIILNLCSDTTAFEDRL